MKTTRETPIRRRPDGSIDTTFYLARGRDARSHATYGGCARVLAALRHLRDGRRLHEAEI